MRKVWVLDTETKGTGAEMVPLEKLRQKPASKFWPPFLEPAKPAERPEPPAEPIQPRRFKIVDIVSREVLAEDVDARNAVDVLEEVRSVVDVMVYVRREDVPEWRLLTLGEQRAIWALRGRARAA